MCNWCPDPFHSWLSHRCGASSSEIRVLWVYEEIRKKYLEWKCPQHLGMHGRLLILCVDLRSPDCIWVVHVQVVLVFFERPRWVWNLDPVFKGILEPMSIACEFKPISWLPLLWELAALKLFNQVSNWYLWGGESLFCSFKNTFFFATGFLKLHVILGIITKS